MTLHFTLQKKKPNTDTENQSDSLIWDSSWWFYRSGAALLSTVWPRSKTTKTRLLFWIRLIPVKSLESNLFFVPQQNVLTLKELIEQGWSTQCFPAALGDSGKDKLPFRSSEQTPLRVGRHRNIQLHWNFDGGTYEA